MLTLISVVASLLLSLPAIGTEQEADVFVPLEKYIQTGDTESLSAWFDDRLEVDILGKTNVVSKHQAKQILKDFFDENSPKNFQFTHRGGKAPIKYAVGSLNAGGSKFRVTVFVKTQPDGNFIQQIRIEKE